MSLIMGEKMAPLTRLSSTVVWFNGLCRVMSVSGSRGGGRSGQSEGRRATISSALELEGTVSHEGDLTNFITKNLEQKIKMSSKPSLDCSDCEFSSLFHLGVVRKLFFTSSQCDSSEDIKTSCWRLLLFQIRLTTIHFG